MAGTTVDVIVDNHDYGRFLPAAIDSALAQTYPATVIVVDDGSTDASRVVIAGYGDRVRPVLKDNGGQASALNAGFARSTGGLVLFLDADDVLLPWAVERYVDALERSPGAAKLQQPMEVIDVDGRRTGSRKPPPHLPLRSGDLRRHELAQPFDLTWMSTSGMAFPRWVLERLLPIPEETFRRSADWYLQHLPALLGPVVSLPEPGALYRIHGGNAYATSAPRLDLDQVRQSIAFAAATRDELVRLADELGLPHHRVLLSSADLANRLVSLRLERARHPLPADRAGRVVLDGIRSAGRRLDAHPVLRLLLVAWFLAAGVAPRPLARRLGELFLLPERRPAGNALLGRLQRHDGCTA